MKSSIYLIIVAIVFCFAICNNKTYKNTNNLSVQQINKKKIVAQKPITDNIYQCTSGIAFALNKKWKHLNDSLFYLKIAKARNLIKSNSIKKFDDCFIKTDNTDSIDFSNTFIAINSTIVLNNKVKKNMNQAYSVLKKLKQKENLINELFIDSLIKDNYNIEIDNNVFIDSINNIIFMINDYEFNDQKGYLIISYVFSSNSVEDIWGLTSSRNLDELGEIIGIVYSKISFNEDDEYLWLKYYKEAENAIDDSKSIILYSLAIEEMQESNTYYISYAYLNRGFRKAKNNNYESAIDDFNKCISVSTDNELKITAIRNRGLSLIVLGKNGCNDLLSAKNMGDNLASVLYEKYCK